MQTSPNCFTNWFCCSWKICFFSKDSDSNGKTVLSCLWLWVHIWSCLTSGWLIVCTTVKRFFWGTSKSCTPGSICLWALEFFSLMALLYPLCQLFGHFRPDIIFCLGPVCVRLCLRLKMPFLHPTRTRGLAVPVDVSLYGVTSSPNVTSCIVSPFGIFPSL